jgi:hypothetical protein
VVFHLFLPYGSTVIRHALHQEKQQQQQKATIMANIIVPLTENNILSTGLQIIGCTLSSEKRRQEIFVSWYGSMPKACCALWNDITTADLGAARIEKPELKYLLMTLHWLYSYNKLKAIGTVFRMHEDTVGKTVWKYAMTIEALKEIKVK